MIDWQDEIQTTLSSSSDRPWCKVFASGFKRQQFY